MRRRRGRQVHERFTTASQFTFSRHSHEDDSLLPPLSQHVALRVATAFIRRLDFGLLLYSSRSAFTLLWLCTYIALQLRSQSDVVHCKLNPGYQPARYELQQLTLSSMDCTTRDHHWIRRRPLTTTPQAIIITEGTTTNTTTVRYQLPNGECTSPYGDCISPMAAAPTAVYKPDAVRYCTTTLYSSHSPLVHRVYSSLSLFINSLPLHHHYFCEYVHRT